MGLDLFGLPQEADEQIEGVDGLVDEHAAALGLPPAASEKCLRRWATRGYLTVIRANWDILPAEQLLELLGWERGKLVRVLQGRVFDVAVDLRANSPTFGKWFGVELSDENMKQFYIPEGFAHGFYVMSDVAVFAYKCTDFYHPGDEGGMKWDDPEIGIEWPLDGEPLLSEKDRKWLGIRDTFHFGA